MIPPYHAADESPGEAGNKRITGGVVLLVGGILLILVAGVLKALYSLPFSGTFLWYAGAMVAFYPTGYCLVRLTRGQSGEFFLDVSHAMALGVALMPLVYSLFRRLSHPEFIFIFCAVFLIVWLVLAMRDYRRKELVPETSLYDIASVCSLVLLVLVLLHLSHFTDVLLLDDGFKIRSTLLTESDFHLGIIKALANAYPPVSPYASGTSLAYYHMNLHLEVEMVHRLIGMDTLRLTFFFFPLLYFLLLVGMVYFFVRACKAPRWVALFTSLLIFGADLSFIPGLLNMLSGRNPWTVAFYTTIWSLFTLNGYLPALIVLFLCMAYLKRYYEQGDASLLVVFGFLVFSSYGFKSSMGLHIVAAAFITGVGSAVFSEDKRKGALVCAISLVAAVCIAINVVLLRGGIGQNIVAWAPLNNFYASLGRVGIRTISWNYLPLFLLVYIIMLLGPRIIWIPLADAMMKKRRFDPMLFFILIFGLTGVVVSDMIYLGTLARAANDSVWFAVQSLICAWLMVPYFLEKAESRKKKAVIAVIIVVLALPTTLQFLKMRFDNRYVHIDGDAMEVITYLKDTPPGSVVLHEMNRDMPSLSANFAGRSSVLSFFRSFVTPHLTKEEFSRRLTDILVFFSADDSGKRAGILDRYGVDYVYAARSAASMLDAEARLTPVLKNRSYVVYAVKK